VQENRKFLQILLVHFNFHISLPAPCNVHSDYHNSMTHTDSIQQLMSLPSTNHIIQFNAFICCPTQWSKHNVAANVDYGPETEYMQNSHMQSAYCMRSSKATGMTTCLCFAGRGRPSLLLCVGWLFGYQPKGDDALRLGSKGRHGVICR